MGDRRDPGVPGERVALNHPVQVEFAPDGRMYLAAWHNHKVRRWDPETTFVRVVVANHDQTTGNNGGFTGDGGPAEEAHVNFPSSLAFDADGVMYLLDQKNVRIRRVDLDGMITTAAGSGESGRQDGPALDASFQFASNPLSNQPPPGGSVEVDRDAGVLWIADSFNGVLRHLDLLTGEVGTLEVDGLQVPNDLELGPDGRIYVVDSAAHVVVAVDPSTGDSEVVLGTGTAGRGEDGSIATDYALSGPMGLDVADDGSIWVADTLNSSIVRVTP
jgi:sugar lactone lactonase YvrE